MKTFYKRRASMLALAAASALSLSGQSALALGQAAEDATSDDQATGVSQTSQERRRGLETIIVVAQKIEEDVQDVPIAVSAYGDDFITENLVNSIEDLALYTPSLNVNSVQGGGISIRGIAPTFSGNFTNAPVAVYVDGVFQGAAGSAAYLFSDISSVEVLRGPQGTLFGRNATGGAINVNTRLPTNEWSGYIEGTGVYGEAIGIGPDYANWRGRASIGGPLIEDRLLFKTSIAYQDSGDFIHNFVDDVDSNGSEQFDIRSQLIFTPNDDVSLRLIYDRSDQETERFDFADKNNALIDSFVPFLQAPADEFYRLGGSAAGDQGFIDRETEGVSAQLDIDLNEQVTFTSITAYREAESMTAFDIDGTSVPLILTGGDNPSDQFSQEARVSYQGDRLDFVLGGYFYEESADSTPGAGIRATIDTEALAAFAQGTYRLNDVLSATIGLRYSTEDKAVTYDLDPGVPFIADVDDSWDSLTPRFALEAQLDENTLLYGSISKGFKSGGFGFGGNPVDPETLWNYEVGLKSDINEDLRLNVATFYMDYTDLQVRTPNPLFPGTFTIDNAAESRVWGVEAETTWLPSDRWLFSGALSYLNSEYEDFESLCGFPQTPCNLAGNQLIAAPEWKVSGAAQYTVPLANGGELSLRGTAQYEDEAFASEYNRPEERVDEKFNVNAFATYTSPNGAWQLSAFGMNLNDRVTELGNVYVPIPGLIPRPILAVFPQGGRQWGLRLRYNY